MDWLIDEFLREVLGLERVADVFGALVSVAFVVSILLCVRVVWVKGTRPNAALAWIATLLALPVVGALLYLIISLIAVAMTFFALGAPFAGVLEVIAYAGAIMVLFVFVVINDKAPLIWSTGLVNVEPWAVA